ncbi:MAG: peptidyl-prolyl cis-trans isomerase [Victivallales bacterium]|nr:peptidyl-prolyl cis-trans isomerase [Victivallales bacterium]
MIISRFNKYVEKHGRVTYIVLGIIIAFMFVIFVTPDGAGGCRGGGATNNIGRIFGKKIYVDDFMKMRNETNVAFAIRTNYLPSQYGDKLWNQVTVQRIIQVMKAGKLGLIKQVTDQEVADTIAKLAWLKDDKGNFSVENFTNFKNGFLRNNGLNAKDFDELIRHNIAIERMQEQATASAAVSDAEVDAEVTRYKVSYSEVSLDTEKAAAPTAAEIQAFFDTRKAEIPLGKERRAVVASITVPAAVASAGKPDAPAELKTAATVTDEEVKKHFESNKDRFYKDKTLDNVKSSIRLQLRNNKMRAYLRDSLGKLRGELTKALAGLEPAAAEEKFASLATAAGATVTKAGFLGEGNEIPGLKGSHAALANQIRSLDKPAAFTDVVADGGGFSIALLAELKDGTLPEKLDDNLSKKISTMLIDEKALGFYDQEVAPYKPYAEGTTSSWDLGRRKAEEIQADKSLTEEQKQASITEYSEKLREYVFPFYRAEQRAFAAVTFTPADFEAEVTLTEAEIQKGFDARKSEYEQVKVNLSQVVVKVAADADEAAKAAAQKKIDEAYAKLTGGTELAAVVKEYSEDTGTASKGGETGLVNLSSLPEAVRTQIEKMQANQVSPVLDTADGKMFFKLLEKQAPRTLADVREALVPELKREAARRLAQEAAENLARKVRTAWNDAGHQVENKTGLLKTHAESTKGKFSEHPLTVQNNYASRGLAHDRAVMSAVFSATPEEPYTDAVNGDEASYVLCLAERKAAYIAEPADVKAALRNVYKRSVATKKALEDATAEQTRINTALKAGEELSKAAGDKQVFKELEKELTASAAHDTGTLHIRDNQGLFKALAQAEDKTVIAPQRSYTGYNLVYLASRTVPQGDAAKEERDKAHERLLQQKKSRLARQFAEDLQKEADPQLIPSLME